MVVALIALAIALGGTALAAPQEKFGSLNRSTVAKIAKREARTIIGKRAAKLNVASAATATTAQSAGTAQQAANAAQLGGRPAGDYALSQGEPYRAVGAPGQPGFESGWTNFPEGLATVAFYKDPVGVVHLRGTALSPAKISNLAAIFTLPPGYRPSATLYFNIFDIDATQPLYVGANGAIVTGCDKSTCYAPLDGISFRAEQ